jgi:lysophospholipase L1-like esterase
MARRLPRRQSPRLDLQPGGLLLGLVLGLLVGGGLGLWGRLPLHSPRAINTEVWRLISPGGDVGVVSQGIGRGVHIAEGALLIRPHVFSRSDLLSYVHTQGIGRIEVEPASGSGLFRLNLRGPGGTPPIFMLLSPSSYAIGATPGATIPRPTDGPVILTAAGGQVSLDVGDGPQVIGQGGITELELTGNDEEVRIARVAISDTAGAELYAETFVDQPLVPLGGLFGALLGASAGLAATVVVRRGRNRIEGALAVAALALPAALALWMPSRHWLYLAERLYLAHTPSWELARIGLLLGLTPLWVGGLLRSGLLAPRVGPAASPSVLWYALAAACSLLGVRDLGVMGVPIALVGALVLISPLRVVKAAWADPARWLLQDAPAFVLIAVLGWPLGLLPAALWRLLHLGAAAPSLLRRGASEGADQLFVFGLLALLGLELAARDSRLDNSWNIERLTGMTVVGAPWQDPFPYWSEQCGSGGRTLVFVGGSSTGGAYQLSKEPEAYFAAQTHAALCASRAPDQALHTFNFGDGGRDTFTIARSLDNILAQAPADVLVAYIGVNDILGAQNAMSRKQREAAIAARGEALAGLGRLADHSRVLTGIGLLLRPLQAGQGGHVPDVPLPDAEENLRAVAATMGARGGALLLVTELLAADEGDRLAPYNALLQRLDAEYPQVRHVNSRDLLGPDDGLLLVDRNHLSKEGHKRLGAALGPVVAELLDWGSP